MRSKSILLILFSIFFLSCSIESNEAPDLSEDMINDTIIEKSENEERIDYVYKHRSEMKHGNDREKYIWDLLRLSLEATVDDYGPYEMKGVEDINQIREDVELINNTGRITIISDSLNEDNLNNLDRIEVPLLRNLLGYRVFFIKEDRQNEFDEVRDLNGLRKFSFGIGAGWNDKIILDHAQITVYEENKYEALYRSLDNNHYDVFSRGVNEILGEYEAYKEDYPNLKIEDNLLLFYPLPRYFWFSKSDHGQMLRDRVDVGLKRIIENGQYYELFSSYYAKDLELLNLNERVLVELENPIYTDEINNVDALYRYNPID